MIPLSLRKSARAVSEVNKIDCKRLFFARFSLNCDSLSRWRALTVAYMSYNCMVSKTIKMRQRTYQSWDWLLIQWNETAVPSALVTKPCRTALDELQFMGPKSLGGSDFCTIEFLVVQRWTPCFSSFFSHHNLLMARNSPWFVNDVALSGRNKYSAKSSKIYGSPVRRFKSSGSRSVEYSFCCGISTIRIPVNV